MSAVEKRSWRTKATMRRQMSDVNDDSTLKKTRGRDVLDFLYHGRTKNDPASLRGWDVTPPATTRLLTTSGTLPETFLVALDHRRTFNGRVEVVFVQRWTAARRLQCTFRQCTIRAYILAKYCALVTISLLLNLSKVIKVLALFLCKLRPFDHCRGLRVIFCCLLLLVEDALPGFCVVVARRT